MPSYGALVRSASDSPVRGSRGRAPRTRRQTGTQFDGLRPSPTTFFWTPEMQQLPATGGGTSDFR